MSKISELEDKNYAQFKEIQSLIEERDKRIDKWAEIVQKLEAEVQEFRDADTEGNGLLRIAYRTLEAENAELKEHWKNALNHSTLILEKLAVSEKAFKDKKCGHIGT